MQQLKIHEIRSILCIGAHPDDIEIGCGGAIGSLLDRQSDVHVHWAVFSGDPVRQREALHSAEAWLARAGSRQIDQFAFQDGYFPAQYREIKEQLHRLDAIEPDVIFTHRLEDRHQDHRLLAELTWNAFRNHMVLEYEIPKYEGDFGQPNVYVSLSEEEVERKTARLDEHFVSQAAKPWFDPRLFAGHLRLRGTECQCDYAEAFHARKACLTF